MQNEVTKDLLIYIFRDKVNEFIPESENRKIVEVKEVLNSS